LLNYQAVEEEFEHVDHMYGRMFDRFFAVKGE
jgi:hypothetical protein